MTREELIRLLKDEISHETKIPASEIKSEESFYSLGLDSISCVFVLDELSKKLNLDLNPILFWDFPTVDLLASHIISLLHHEQ
jgi:acyl carrier protein